MHGDFYLRVGVQEVRFDDGSVWRRQPPGGPVKSNYLDPTSPARFPTLAALNPGASPPPNVSGLSVDDARGSKVSRWAWDVFLVAGP